MYTNPSGTTWHMQNTTIASVNGTGTITGQSLGQTLASAVTSPYPIYATVCSEGNAASCPQAPLGGSGNTNVPPSVTFGPLTAVTVNGSVPVSVTFSGNATSSPVPITLSISMLSGTGSAIFSTGGTSTTITAPTTVMIKGITASSMQNNMLLNATILQSDGLGTQEDATNPQAFTVMSVAVPVGFKQKTGTSDSSGNLHFSYAWTSSTGNPSDLSNCWIMENVQYVGGNPFRWPSPPYIPGQTSPNPTRNDGQGDDPPMIEGNVESILDTQANPGFQGPYVANTVTSTQTFLWECSNLNNGAFTAFPNISYPISRTVQADGKGGWEYTVTKNGVSATIDPLP